MGMFDYTLNNFNPYQGGLFGALGNNDMAALVRAYGGYKKPEEQPAQDPLNGDQSGSAPIGAAAPNPYGSPSSLMPAFTSTIPAQDQQQPNGPMIRPGSFFDKLFGQPNIAANAAPMPPQPNMSGAEPSAAWTGAPQQTANVPMPPPRPAPGVNLGAPTQPGPPLNITPQIQDAPAPPNAQPAQAQPQAQPQSAGPSFMQSFGNKMQNIAGILDPSQQAKLQKTGTDPFTGQDTFAWVNPANQTMKPATISGQPSGTGNAPGGMGQFAEAVRAGVGGDQLMKLAPPEIKNRLQAMLDGREAPPTGAGLRNPQVQALINAAHAIDPNFDETKWGIRFAQRKNYEAGGKQFQEAQALNTVSGHLVNLMKSADALDNTPIPIVNGVMNWLRQNTGDPRVDKLNTDVHAVTSELSKAYKAGHVSDSDVRAWNNNINSAKSPEQFKAVIGELNDLLRSKRETLDEGYRSAMGKTPLPAEYSSQSERSKGNFDSVSDWSLGNKKPAASGWSVKKL